MSKATVSFLKHMKAHCSTTIDLRRYLEEWDFHLGQVTKSMWGPISLSTPFTPLEGAVEESPLKRAVEESKTAPKKEEAIF